jgi:hypothetical protein
MRDMIGMMLSGQAPDTASYETVSSIPDEIDKTTYPETYFERSAHPEKVMQLSGEIRNLVKTLLRESETSSEVKERYMVTIHKVVQKKTMLKVMVWRVMGRSRVTSKTLGVRQRLSSVVNTRTRSRYRR